MRQYLDALQDILENGIERTNRTGINTISKFGISLRINLADGFPLLTTKKVWFKGIIGELIWMLQGKTDVMSLDEQGIHIWDAWADENGKLGPVYGKQWRDWSGIDQIGEAIRLIKEEPNSRRIIISNWNVAELSQMRLPPCHILAQFYVRGNLLDCSVYQRSGDMFLGIPFDIASYAALVSFIGKLTGKIPGVLYYTIGDAHIYINHIYQVKEQLSREPRELPRLTIRSGICLENVSVEDFRLSGYNPMPAIKADVAI